MFAIIKSCHFNLFIKNNIMWGVYELNWNWCKNDSFWHMDSEIDQKIYMGPFSFFTQGERQARHTQKNLVFHFFCSQIY